MDTNISESESEVYEADESSSKRSFFETLKAKRKTVVSLAVVVAVILVLYFYKGLFITATVNGSPISRLSVVRELEKQSGKQVLESLISRKLVEMELESKGVEVTQEEIDAELKKIEGRVTAQGGTLEQALSMQGMTMDQLKEQVTVQKKMEKVLSDKIQVSDSEIDKYIKDNKIAIPKGVSKDDFRAQIGEQLKLGKLQNEAQSWVAELTSSATIKYFVEY